MRGQFSQRTTIVLLNGIGRVQLLDLTIRIDGNKNVRHIGLSEELTRTITRVSLTDWGTHVDLVFVIARFQVIQKCGLIE